MRLEPYYPVWFLFHLGGAYEMAEHYNEALKVWQQALNRSQKGEMPPVYAHERLAIYYARSDQMGMAKKHANAILKIDPKYSVLKFKKTLLKSKDDHSSGIEPFLGRGTSQMYFPDK